MDPGKGEGLAAWPRILPARCPVAGGVQSRSQRLNSPQTPPAGATLPPTPPPPTLLPSRFAHGKETLGDAQRLGN